MASSRFQVGIVGGGPGGLMLAYRLGLMGQGLFEVMIFEASQRVGGKVRTLPIGLHGEGAYEAGAAEFYDYSPLGPDPLRELIGELGLETAPMRAGGGVFRGHPVSEAEDLVRVFGREVADQLELFRLRARSEITTADYYESDWKEDRRDPLARQTFEDFLRTLPSAEARDYVRVMTHSDLACETHQTSASYGLQNYLMDEPDYLRLYGIVGGNERLVEALAARVGGGVRLGERVVRVGLREGRYAVVSRRKGGEEVVTLFDAVVLALPNDCLLGIQWEGDVLEAAMRKHHRFYDHPAHYLRVTVMFDCPFWRDVMSGHFFMLEAFGGVCAYDETARFDAGGRGVLGFLIGGDPALRLGNGSDSEILEAVLEGIPETLGRRGAAVLDFRIHRWAKCVNGLPSGFPAKEPDSRHQPEPKEHPRLFVVGDYLFDSTLNGVLDSADTVAEWLVEEASGIGEEGALVQESTS
jgi:monoamine oxidase